MPSSAQDSGFTEPRWLGSLDRMSDAYTALTALSAGDTPAGGQLVGYKDSPVWVKITQSKVEA